MLKITIIGGGGGPNWFDHQEYTPLYEKGVKKTENKSMETTLSWTFQIMPAYLWLIGTSGKTIGQIPFFGDLAKTTAVGI